MKYTYKKEDGELSIFDSKGNKVYYEDSNGDWIKNKYDSKGNEVYWENSNGFWAKKEYDSKRKMIYYEDSNGKIISNKPKPKIKPKTITAKNTDEAIKKVKEDLK